MGFPQALLETPRSLKCLSLCARPAFCRSLSIFLNLCMSSLFSRPILGGVHPEIVATLPACNASASRVAQRAIAGTINIAVIARGPHREARP